jgi:outer membrane protein
VFLTGQSDESDPPGYVVYSALGLEAGLDRALSRRFAAALTVRTESREVDVAAAGSPDTRLGSLEFLPVSVFFQYRPHPDGSFHPYVGAGANLTVVWEKSGALDSDDVSPSLGPAVQIGADFDLGPAMLWTLEARWNAHRTELRSGPTKPVSLTLDTVVLGAGVGFRF